MPSIYLYTIAAVSIVLGFFALLKQKTYIDSETNQPTEVEIPKIGKLKTNYPALVFVFLGFAAAIFAFHNSQTKEKVEWSIKGSILTPANKNIDWTRSEFTIKPTDVAYEIDSLGNFEITLDLDKGATFEDKVEWLCFVHPSGTVEIFPEDELTKYSKGDSLSLLNKKKRTSRFYKPFPVKF